jgi:hypothetical protein
LRYKEPIHPYELQYFECLGSFIMGPDNKCTCTINQYCPLRKTGEEPRCSTEELQKLSNEATWRRGYQSGD